MIPTRGCISNIMVNGLEESSQENSRSRSRIFVPYEADLITTGKPERLLEESIKPENELIDAPAYTYKNKKDSKKAHAT